MGRKANMIRRKLKEQATLVSKRNFDNSGNWKLKLNIPVPDWSEMNLEEIKKDFYQEHPLVTARDEDAIKEYRDQNKIIVRGRDCPKPVQAFDECSFSESIMSAVKAQNFTKPMPIQSQALPVALSGRDMVGIAETGSGKTLAFILPAITHIHGKDHHGEVGQPDVVVVAPTRELAQQIHQVTLSLGPGIKVNSACFYGGDKRKPQENRAKTAFEICIGTPGRLVSFLYDGLLKLNRCTYFVLDEADRMLDMGFEPQIKAIIGQARPDRQMLMFSATWPPLIKNLAEKYLKDYVLINVGSLQISANHSITQKVEICRHNDKPQRIVKIMKDIMEQKENKTLIFANSRIDVDILTLKFRMNGWNAFGLHGCKVQSEREKVFGDFKNGKISILIATDLAARGLDVDDIKFIVNYDYPKYTTDYVHRIGRTGRCGRTGTAITLFNPDERKKAKDLISILKEADQHVPPELQHIVGPPPIPSVEPFVEMKGKEPKGLKRQLKRLVTISEVNSFPLGTTTNTESLPDLRELVDPIVLEKFACVKGSKKRRRRFPISEVIAGMAENQVIYQPVEVQQPPDCFRQTENKQTSQMPTPMSGIVLNMPNENFLSNFSVLPAVMQCDQGLIQSRVESVQHESPTFSDLGWSGARPCKKMKVSEADTVSSHDPAMHSVSDQVNDSDQEQQRMGQHLGMATGYRYMGMNSGNVGMPMDLRNSGRSWHPRYGGISMDFRNMRGNSTMRWQVAGGWGSPLYANYMGPEARGWMEYRNKYHLNTSYLYM